MSGRPVEDRPFASLAGPKVPAEHALRGLGIWVQLEDGLIQLAKNTPGGIAATAARGAAPPWTRKRSEAGHGPAGQQECGS